MRVEGNGVFGWLLSHHFDVATGSFYVYYVVYDFTSSQRSCACNFWRVFVCYHCVIACVYRVYIYVSCRFSTALSNKLLYLCVVTF
jgi:hypothetical protein